MAAAADGARRAVDHRQRHALPADAVHPRGGPRPGHHPRAHVLRRRRRGRGAGVRPVPRPGDATGRHGPGRSRTRRCIPRRRWTRTTTRSPSAGRSSWSTSAWRRPTLILERLEESDASMRVAQLRALGGAMARVPNSATAFAHRSSRSWRPWLRSPTTSTTSRAGRPGSRTSSGRSSRATPAPMSTSSPRKARSRIRDAYPGTTWDRLAAIKGQYDPDNLFHLNQNVPPAA